MELPTAYDPKKVEDKIYQLWLKSGFFNPDKLPKTHKKPFTIAVPPPNITGELHMGHALNATVQDILIRWKRMQGFKALWLPGTDHAGIAAQNVVEKQLKKENLRDNMTNLELVLNMLAEATTTEFSKKEDPKTFDQSKDIATKGGNVAGNARKDIEKQLGEPVVTSKNVKLALKPQKIEDKNAK